MALGFAGRTLVEGRSDSSEGQVGSVRGAFEVTGPGNSKWLGWAGNKAGGNIETSPDSTMIETSSSGSVEFMARISIDHRPPDWFAKSWRLCQKPECVRYGTKDVVAETL